MKSLLSNVAELATERVFLVGAEFRSRAEELPVSELLAELGELASTAGGTVVGSASQRLDGPNPATFIGGGKAGEIAEACRALEVDTVIFDDELSPAQARNLEEQFGCKILDRTNLILDIFASRARTKEGKLQVELAQLKYLLPRLTGYWTHLSRQRGGIGMRGGEGESQLEVDRRKIGERIDKLERELDAVRRQRDTQRRGRRRHHWPLASLVGYTNAGKSTLFNSLTGADVLQEDQLFATLDPTTRRLHLPTNQDVLLSDTVGFIRKLPHRLVEAFKATLEEVVEADLLLHVVDVTHPQMELQIEAVDIVLNEIGCDSKPTLLVFNKIDQLENALDVRPLLSRFERSLAVSARNGSGFDGLYSELGAALRPLRMMLDLAIPFEASDIIARLHEVGQVVEKDYSGEQARLKVRVPPHLVNEFIRHVAPAD
jgi:GTP-binding protein HflX